MEYNFCNRLHCICDRSSDDIILLVVISLGSDGKIQLYFEADKTQANHREFCGHPDSF